MTDESTVRCQALNPLMRLHAGKIVSLKLEKPLKPKKPPDISLVQPDSEPARVRVCNVGGRRPSPLCRTLLWHRLPPRPTHLHRKELPTEETKDQHNQRA